MIFRYRWFTCTEKNSELHNGNSKRFLYMWQSRSFSFPIRVSYETTLRAKEWGWENCLHVPSFPKGHVWICPFMSQTVILGLFSTNFQLENKSLHLPWIRIYTAYVLESRLTFIDGATQIPISEFEASRWNNSRVYCLCNGVEAYFHRWCNTNPDFGIWSK